MRLPRALTVAGSDSGGGAGIQADLKTFAALGVHGMSAITCITAQNTYQVSKVVALDPDMVEEQIRVCIDDLGVDVVKTGMLYSSAIIERVSDVLSRVDVPIVVDPVMIAKSGAPLLRDDAMEALKRRLIPLSTIVTPNVHEASKLAGIDIVDKYSQRESARRIAELGCRAVVVKGGHIKGEKSVDILYVDGRYYEYEAERVDTRATHGTGCVFASAIAAELAKGAPIEEAVKEAKLFVWNSLKYGLELGRGSGPVNPTWSSYRESSLLRVINRVEEAVHRLESIDGAADLSPESMINIAEAIPLASGREDVIGVPGRIVKIDGRLKASSCPKPGGSRHVADAVLELNSLDRRVRAAINVAFSEKVIKAAENLGMSISSYDRSREPDHIKRVEGMSIKWGMREAYESAGKVTDIIYHRGDVGKEPMVLITGKDSLEVVSKFEKILKEMRGDDLRNT